MDLESSVKLVTPFAAVVFSIVANKLSEKRANVLYHFGHISTFRIKGSAPAAQAPQSPLEESDTGAIPQPSTNDGNPSTPPSDSTVYAHSVILRNSGKKTASNVRVLHYVLPTNFHVYPPIDYSVRKLGDDFASEILVPKLVAGKQVTISYLYFPPITWNQIHAAVEFDDGPAKLVEALANPQPSADVRRLLKLLLLVGIAASVYLLMDIGFRGIEVFRCITTQCRGAPTDTR